MRTLLLAACMLVIGGGVALGATPPPPTNVHVTTATKTSISIAWSGSTKRYAVWLDNHAVTRLNAHSYTYTGLACSTTHTVGVRSVSGASVSVVVSIQAQTLPCGSGGGGDATPIASANCSSRSSCVLPVSLPRSCTATPTTEVVSANATPNHTVGDGSYTWGTEVSATYWSEWGQVLPLAQGAQTGTTDELMQLYSCRWGFASDLFRAVGVQETDWRQALVGDYCGVTGEGSYGIIQIKNRYCNGSLAWGGYPDTQQSTPLALDFYGGYLRACYDGAFYDGGSWLYNGQSVGQIAAARGWDYVLWGCVGSWFSGDWYSSGATSYINSVKSHLANKDWP